MKTPQIRHLLIALSGVLAVATAGNCLYSFVQSSHQSRQWQATQTSISMQQMMLKQDEKRLHSTSAGTQGATGPMSIAKQSDFITDVATLAQRAHVTVTSINDGTSGTSGTPATAGAAQASGATVMQIAGSSSHLLAFTGLLQQELPTVLIASADLPLTSGTTTLTLQVTVPTRGQS